MPLCRRGRHRVAHFNLRLDSVLPLSLSLEIYKIREHIYIYIYRIMQLHAAKASLHLRLAGLNLVSM